MTQTLAVQALAVAEELLADLELSRMPLANCFMKACRLARLLGDVEMLQIFKWELEGYPTTAKGIPAPSWKGCERANRVFEHEDTTKTEVSKRAYTDSVERLEASLELNKARLAAAQDQPVSISSANPTQYVHGPVGNFQERNFVTNTATTTAERLAARRAFLYAYVLERNLELRVSAPAEDLFSERRAAVDRLLSAAAPAELVRIESIAENLRSSNQEDWANAVHSCRRLLQAVADMIYPPREPKVIVIGTKTRTIQLGPEHYINRLATFCEDHSGSERFNELVGSQLALVGDRLDAVFKAAQKGSHADVSREEAARTVVYTYLLIADILELRESGVAAGTETSVQDASDGTASPHEAGPVD